MEQVGISLIDKLPDWYLMVLIPVAVWFVFRYVLPNIRRDKQGKLYFYSQKYEDAKRNRKQDEILGEIKHAEEKFEKINKIIDSMQMVNLRQQIILNIHHAPDKIQVIDELVDKYRSLGGNSYIIQLYEEWKEKYAKPVIRRRITKDSAGNIAGE